eukprot:gene16527-18776_t
MEASNQEELHRVVIEKSETKNWVEAKQEWVLETIYDLPGRCLCHHRITEHCVISNKYNHKRLIVGNVCINHFDEHELNVPANCRASLKRLFDNVESNANRELLDLAVRLKIISLHERDSYIEKTTGEGSRVRFYIDHVNFDQDDYDFRQKINQFIKLGFIHDRPYCFCSHRGKHARPRQNRQTKSFFYACYDYPNGCKFTQSAPTL